MSTALGSSQIDKIIARRQVLVTCGTGGVGKTTLSAAIALRAALNGKKTVVITIDPAKRLITSLGLHEEETQLGDQPTDLTKKIEEAIQKTSYGIDLKGSLEAIVPDTRHTFERFIRELAPSEAVAQRVTNNPIFQIFAKEFSGTNEYMALERLYSLIRQNKYDLIVLDTPPSRNTLAFLNAPKLLVQFFEERMIKWLILPANKLISAGMRKGLSILENLTGAGFMTHLFEFASALFEIRARFTANLNSIMKTLESDDVGFIMVTVPAPDLVPETLHFIETLQRLHFHFDGVAINRSLAHLQDDLSSHSQGQTEAYKRALEILEGLRQKEQTALGEQKIPLLGRLPELARDVHSVEDLLHLAMAFNTHSHSESS